MLCTAVQAIAQPFCAIAAAFSGLAPASSHPLSALEIVTAILVVLAIGSAIAFKIVRRNGTAKERHCKCSSEHLTLTWDALADRLGPPGCSGRLVVLIGAQGSGKTTLAAKLAGKGFEWLSVDRLV